jgi:hypothetical protein
MTRQLRIATRGRLVVALAAMAVLSGAAGYALRARAEGSPTTTPLFYRGTLLDPGGAPLTGNKAIAVSLYDDEKAGTLLCASPPSTVDLAASHGQFRIPLGGPGGTGDCVKAVHDKSDLWVAVAVDGTQPFGRTKLGAVPYALEADHALTVKSLPGINVVTAAVDLPTVPAGTTFPEAAVDVACPAGQKLIAGGCATHHAEWLLWIDAPNDAHNGWSCRAKNVSNAFSAGLKGSSLPGPFNAYAFCAP